MNTFELIALLPRQKGETAEDVALRWFRANFNRPPTKREYDLLMLKLQEVAHLEPSKVRRVSVKRKFVG